jgi:hypothetical protein
MFFKNSDEILERYWDFAMLLSRLLYIFLNYYLLYSNLLIKLLNNINLIQFYIT